MSLENRGQQEDSNMSLEGTRDTSFPELPTGLRAKHHAQGLSKTTGVAFSPLVPTSRPTLCFTRKLSGHRKCAKPGHRAGAFYTSTCRFGLRQLPKEQIDKGSTAQGMPCTIRHATTPST